MKTRRCYALLAALIRACAKKNDLFFGVKYTENETLQPLILLGFITIIPQAPCDAAPLCQVFFILRAPMKCVSVGSDMKHNQSLQKTPASKATELFYTKKEIAKAIKVSERTVENLTSKGVLPSIKMRPCFWGSTHCIRGSNNMCKRSSS